MASPTLHGSAPPAGGIPNSSSEGAAEPDSQLVRDQLERILASAVFKNSKRYAAVLKYITEQTLAGHAEHLKERTIGVDVFGREPDYDTASDHVVRSAMAEVRKRLAQYYQGNHEEDELCLELQPGSYVPLFRNPSRLSRPKSESPLAAELSPLPIIVRRRNRRVWIAGLILGVVVFSAALVSRSLFARGDAMAAFWGPVLDSPSAVMLCIGNLEGGSKPGFNASPVDLRNLSMGDFHHLPSQMMTISDATALAKLSGFLQARNKRWRVLGQSDVNYGDLRNGPAILIGLMNNDWTERLVGTLRYRAVRTAPRKVVIRDTRNPLKDDWSMDYATPLLNITRDYALVLRYFDPNTDQTVVTAAGISVFGTIAATEFLTDARELKELDSAVPGWRKKNLEIVLTTEVVRAKSGRPQIIAAQVW